MATIPDLLEQSRNQHRLYQLHLPHAEADGGQIRFTAGDLVAARAALAEAHRLRQVAHQQDPQHAHTAWKHEPATHHHEELVAFYEAELARL